MPDGGSIVRRLPFRRLRRVDPLVVRRATAIASSQVSSGAAIELGTPVDDDHAVRLDDDRGTVLEAAEVGGGDAVTGEPQIGRAIGVEPGDGQVGFVVTAWRGRARDDDLAVRPHREVVEDVPGSKRDRDLGVTAKGRVHRTGGCQLGDLRLSGRPAPTAMRPSACSASRATETWSGQR